MALKFYSEPISHGKLLELMSYDAETGDFTRRAYVGRGSNGEESKVTTHGKSRAYLGVTVAGRYYRAHRLAFFYVHGRWPGIIDHINGDKKDNRMANLRECDHFINMQNLHLPPSTNTSGLLGVSFCKKAQLWKAQIQIENKKYVIGFYESKDIAHACYLAVKRIFHKGCTI